MSGQTDLHKACREGSAADVSRLINSSPDLLGVLGNDWTALMIAAVRGASDCVRLLAPYESCIVDSSGFSALMLGAQKGHAHICSMLLEMEAGMTRNTGATALTFAAENGHPNCARILAPIEAGMARSNGLTALQLAAYFGHAHVVRVLLAYPQEFGLVDEKGETALYNACAQGHLQIVQLLAPVEADTPNNRGITPMQVADGKHHLQVSGWLRKYRSYVASHGSVPNMRVPLAGQPVAEPTGMMRAAGLNRPDDLARLIATHPEQLGKALHTKTAMTLAAFKGYIECVRLLAPYEAMLVDGDGDTALANACYAGHEEVVDFLIPFEAGCRNAKGATAAMLAATQGKLGCLRKIIPHERMLLTLRGNTGLHLSSLAGRRDVVAILAPFESGATDPDGDTALFCAAIKEHVDCVQELLPFERSILCRGRVRPDEWATARATTAVREAFGNHSIANTRAPAVSDLGDAARALSDVLPSFVAPPESDDESEPRNTGLAPDVCHVLSPCVSFWHTGDSFVFDICFAPGVTSHRLQLRSAKTSNGSVSSFF
jgi:ankyrin repeat protein